MNTTEAFSTMKAEQLIEINGGGEDIVPEPITMVNLSALGIMGMGLAFVRRRKRR